MRVAIGPAQKSVRSTTSVPDSASSPSVRGTGGHAVSRTWMGSPGARPVCPPSPHCSQ